MRGHPFRSLYYAALLCGATALSGCTGRTEPDIAAKPSSARDSAGLRAPLAGPVAANANRRASDDEFAVDAREVTRRPGAGGALPVATRTAVAKPANPPKLNVLYVSNGRIRAYGPAIWIRGTVEDDTDGTEVTVNGQKAQVKDKSFQRRVAVPPGETDVTVRAEDIDGNVTTSRFTLVRSGSGQSLPVARPPAESAAPETKFTLQSGPDGVPRIEDEREAGVYMVLMAGTPSAHFVKMPNLAQCREAVEYTENAACTFHRGRE